ncbi:hypothetical protein ABQE62_30905 [Mycolicibacterium fortuitum]
MTGFTGTPQYFDPLNPAHLADPDGLMAASRKGRPVGHVSDILYTVHSDAAVRQIFEDTTHFSNRGNFSVGSEDVQLPATVITLADPPDHTALRARLLKDLSPARLRKLAPKVKEIVEDCIAGLPKAGVVDLYAEYFIFIPARILYAMIGIPESDWNQIQRWSDVVVARLPEPAHELPEFISLRDYLGRLVQERRSSPSNRHEDVLDNLCFDETSETDVPAPAVILHIFQLVLAATDTTRGLLANCLFRLLDKRDQWEAVLLDRSALPNAIEESLRMDAPGQFMVRSVVEDTTSAPARSPPARKSTWIFSPPTMMKNGGATTLARTVSTDPTRPGTCPSDAASTPASVRPWPESRPGSRSQRFSTDIPT